MSKQSLSEQLWQGLGDAVNDIRQKAVEEPMWGRDLGENDAPRWPEPSEPEPSFGSHTHTRDVEPERDMERDLDLDR